MSLQFVSGAGSNGKQLPLTAAQLYPCCVRVTIDDTQTNEHGCVPLKLYLWTPEYEFHIILCHVTVLLDFFFSII